MPYLFTHICRVTGNYIFQYKENCVVIIYYPKIGGENIKEFPKKAIWNIFQANIDVNSRRLIDEFPGDGVKCIERIQSQCANMTFFGKK